MKNNLELIFEDIPIFSGLLPSEKEIVRNSVQFKEFKKGQIIYKEGSPADAFYCLLSGRVLLYTGEEPNKVILEYLHRGKYFGIISLLTGEPHSVTAQAINDSVLLVIPKDDFKLILEKIPSIAIDLSKSLSRRLKRKDIHQKIIFESTLIGIYSHSSESQKNLYSLNLALGLEDQTKKSVIILEIVPKEGNFSIFKDLELQEIAGLKIFQEKNISYQRLKEFIKQTKFKIDLLGVNFLAEDKDMPKVILGILSFLVNDYHYLILNFPCELNENIVSLLNQMDQIHLLSSPDEVELKRTHNLIERLNKEFGFSKERIKIIITEYKFAKLSYIEERNLLGCDVFATLPHIQGIPLRKIYLEQKDSEYSRAIKRISRQIGERQVGLALGVGVAYGFCHIGVLKVIEEENIPIDMIAGASSGALIAGLWAIGKSAEEILEIAKEFKDPKKIWSMVDLTFPWLGFIKGNKLYRFLKRYFGNKTFYDTKLPLKVVASDIRKKEPLIFQKGLIIDALMASCAMPGVFRPTCVKEQVLLVDGGVSNPVPCEVLFKAGIRKIIAVNVTPTREDILQQYAKLKQEFSQTKRGVFSYLKNKLRINILDIIFSSIEVMQSEIAQKETIYADVVLHPDTSGLHWLELHRAEEFAKRGEEEARKNLERIWQLIKE